MRAADDADQPDQPGPADELAAVDGPTAHDAEILAEIHDDAQALEAVTGPDVGLALGNVTDSVVAVALFVGVNRFVGLSWAIVAATAWALKASITRWRRGLPVGKLMPILTAGIVARGIVGVVTDSEAVYFGLGIAAKAGLGLALIGSALLGRNLVAMVMPYVFGFDATTRAHPVYRRAMTVVAIVAGCAQLVSAAFDVWLFNNSSVNGYVIIRLLVNWPFSTLVVLGCFFYLARALATIPGFPGLTEQMERQMAAYEAALRNRRR